MTKTVPCGTRKAFLGEGEQRCGAIANSYFEGTNRFRAVGSGAGQHIPDLVN